ncbi:MAG: aminopeptidase P family protein, partial [Spirochaetales bacterium]|nr:aminopeptidase P family protein [Spirochaetales bacterium]
EVMYQKRRKKAAKWLADNNIDAAFITADSNVRYLTGMPSDSVFFLFQTGKSILLPWDAILAGKLADADVIIPHTEFNRQIEISVPAILKQEELKPGARIELPSVTSHLQFSRYRKVLDGYELVCRETGFSEYIEELRMVKDDAEIATLLKASELTNTLIDMLKKSVEAGTLRTEVDVALFLDSTARNHGAEGMGFETIAAGPARSYGIHAFPAFTNMNFGTSGMSILDFGVKVDGYTSDITLTVLRGEMSGLQEKMISLVEEAYTLAASMVRPGTGSFDIAKSVDDLFSKAGMSMPHGLGHGIGLDVHEAPWLRVREGSGTILKPGMIFTIEPGLYHEKAGGVRLENDFLITSAGHKVTTRSHLVRLPD